jgi:hypothetical protein
VSVLGGCGAGERGGRSYTCHTMHDHCQLSMNQAHKAFTPAHLPVTHPPTHPPTHPTHQVTTVHKAGVGAALPSSYLQADLDFVAPASPLTPGESALSLAQAIKATVQVLEVLPDLGPWEVRLNHRVLFSATLAALQLPPNSATAVMGQLATAAGVSPGAPEARAACWPGIRNGLDGVGLDSGPVSRCRAAVLQLPGPLAQALQQLRGFLLGGGAPAASGSANNTASGGGNTPGHRKGDAGGLISPRPANNNTTSTAHHTPAAAGAGGPPAGLVGAALEEMGLLGGHLGAWGVGPGRVLLDPLLRPHADYYSGALFQVGGVVYGWDGWQKLWIKHGSCCLHHVWLGCVGMCLHR